MLILLLILLLISLNGYFSAVEIALVSVKKYKIQGEADKGNSNARQVLNYLKNPSEYLSTIQVGLTLIGLVEGLYGGEAFQKFLEPKFIGLGMSDSFAHLSSIIIGIGFISYITILIGELLPKSLALKEPQTLALKIVPSFKIFSFFAFPFVKVLTISTRLILNMIHIGKTENQNLTDADLKSLLGLAYSQGTLEKDELIIHENIFSFYEQRVDSIMTPLSQIVSLQLDFPAEKVDDIMRNNTHNYFPVVDSKNILIGVVCSRDYFRDQDKSIHDQTRPGCLLHQDMKASDLLRKFKDHHKNFGVVVNEKNNLVGLVTMHDIGESLIGEIP